MYFAQTVRQKWLKLVGWNGFTAELINVPDVETYEITLHITTDFMIRRKSKNCLLHENKDGCAMVFITLDI